MTTYSDLTNIVIISTEEDGIVDTVCPDCAASVYEAHNEEEGPFSIERRHTFENNEADAPSHCSVCEVLLEWTMTDDGLEYIRQEVTEALTSALGLSEGRHAPYQSPVEQWHEAYGDYVKEKVLRDYPDVDLDAMLDRDVIRTAYLTAQVWSGSIDWMTGDYEHGGESYMSDSLLDNYVSDIDSLPASILEQADKDVDSFIEQIEPYLFYFVPEFPEQVNNGERFDAEQLGHDLSLTRNHHGAGFWDRGLGDLGTWLTAVSQAMGERSLYGTIQLDPAYRTEDPNGGWDWDINHTIDGTLRVWESN